MIKSSELALTISGILSEESESASGNGTTTDITYRSESSLLSNTRIEDLNNDHIDSGKCEENNEKVPKFAMIFNKYNNKLSAKSYSKSRDDGEATEKTGSKYMMIFNKDVTIRSKPDISQTTSKMELKKAEEVEKSELNVSTNKGSDPPLKAIEQELSSMKLNDAETLMNLYGRSNLFIPELTMCGLVSENEKNKVNENLENEISNERRNHNDNNLKIHSSLTSLKNKTNRRGDNMLKNKIASLTSLETHLARETPRKQVSATQDRKLFRARSLDLSENVTSSANDLDRTFCFQKTASNPTGKESEDERSDKKSRGDALRKAEKESKCRKQVQWKSEVDVIYFESHQAADGDRSGEILGRVMEPLREEWEQVFMPKWFRYR